MKFLVIVSVFFAAISLSQAIRGNLTIVASQKYKILNHGTINVILHGELFNKGVSFLNAAIYQPTTMNLVTTFPDHTKYVTIYWDSITDDPIFLEELKFSEGEFSVNFKLNRTIKSKTSEIFYDKN